MTDQAWVANGELRLPLALLAARFAVSEDEMAQRIAAFQAPRVLLIDDDQDHLRSAKEYLGELGTPMVVDVATTIKAADKLVAKQAYAGALVDVKMDLTGGGDNGAVWLAKHVGAFNTSALLTGYLDHVTSAVKTELQSNAVRFFTKGAKQTPRAFSWLCAGVKRFREEQRGIFGSAIMDVLAAGPSVVGDVKSGLDLRREHELVIREWLAAQAKRPGAGEWSISGQAFSFAELLAEMDKPGSPIRHRLETMYLRALRLLVGVM